MKLARMATLSRSRLFTLAAPGGARAGESTGGLALGAKVPAAVAKTKMKNVDGKMLSIADVTGKAGTLVIFTCNHCPFAQGLGAADRRARPTATPARASASCW